MRVSYQSEIELRPGTVLLEVGCGTGPVSRALAQLRTDCQVFGLDPSPFFLTTARRLAEGIANLQFRQGDARHLPFDPGTFDVLVFTPPFATCLPLTRPWPRPIAFCVPEDSW